MAQTALDRLSKPINTPTALLILEDGTIFEGAGYGAETIHVGEVCFNTSMTGYQEIMTDPSYAGQIINFTFPHIGNVGTNSIDVETEIPAALGMITREHPSNPSNYRADSSLSDWLLENGLPGISGIDTRALTHRIRDKGAPNGVIAVNFSGSFDRDALLKMARSWPGLKGMDLARSVTRESHESWGESLWDKSTDTYRKESDTSLKIIALDYGCKHNILRCLKEEGCSIEVVPATTRAEDIIALEPDGIFLSNGPGDPAATATYAAEEIHQLAAAGLPIFGICIGHQLIAEAFGASTFKMERGHRGANHPVKDLSTGRIEITSQNHGFAVDPGSLPSHLEVTHISLFDGSIEGLRHRELPVFSVQYHPESSPGPHDSRYLFRRFTDMVKRIAHAAS
ncbi:glutamine-hydrolyzing carbamoyl-phosphate synthase small subunit [Alphaproteobacteria bacterium LSUCC0684]